MAAAAAGGTPPPPLRLKDLLEQDCDSCSAAGFRCYPRRLGDSSASASAAMRHLLESSPSSSLSLRRHRTTSSKLSHLSRSLSRRLNLSRRGGGFWSSSRRREDDDEDAETAAAVSATAASTGSGCGSTRRSEEMETSSSSESSDNSCGRTSRRMSRSESDDSDFSSATEDSVHHHSSHAAGAGHKHEVVVAAMKTVVSKEGSSSSGSEADDKEQEQLSPVAVMDFPFDDDDEEELRNAAAVACSPPSFSLERLQRRKTHKIRRFGVSHDEMAPLDLEARLAATTDPDDGLAVPPQQQMMTMIQCRAEDAATPTCAGSCVHDVPHDDDDDDDLISLLMGTPVSDGLDDASERLLLDLFVDMMKRRRSEAHVESELLLPLRGSAAAGGVLRRRKAEGSVDDGEAAVVAAARDWLEGTGTDQRWGLTDVLSGGEAIVAEMDGGRRWMQVGEEEREVGAMVAGMLLDQLVAEMVRSLFV